MFGLTTGQYQYLGVKSINQMEPPSLESMGSLEGKFQHDQQHHSSEHGIGHARTLAGPPPEAPITPNVPPKDANNGWRTVHEHVQSPRMRSLVDSEMSRMASTTKKPCEGTGGRVGRMRSLNEPNAVTPNIMMVDRKNEETPMKEIQRVQLAAQPDLIQEKDLKPNVKESVRNSSIFH